MFGLGALGISGIWAIARGFIMSPTGMIMIVMAVSGGFVTYKYVDRGHQVELLTISNKQFKDANVKLAANLKLAQQINVALDERAVARVKELETACKLRVIIDSAGKEADEKVDNVIGDLLNSLPDGK